MTTLTHHAQTTATANTTGTTITSTGWTADAAIGDTVFAIVGGNVTGGLAGSCADNSANAGAANTWVLDAAIPAATGATLYVFRSNLTRSITIAGAHDITATIGSCSRRAMTVFSVSGWTTAAALDVATSNAGTTSPMSVNTGATPTLYADEFVLAAYGLSASSTPSGYADTAGWTAGVFAGVGTGTNTAGAGYSWRETSATGTQSDSATLGVVAHWGAALLTYPAVVSSSVSVAASPGSASASGGANTAASAMPNGTAGLATADSAGVPSVAMGAAAAPGDATAGSAGANWSTAEPAGVAGLATASAAAPGFGGGTLINVSAPCGSAAASAPVLVVSMATSGPFATATASAPVPVVSMAIPPSAGSATADAAGANQSIAFGIAHAGLATASGGHNSSTLNPPGLTMPGGGGYGAVMSDAHFQRYAPRYRPTLRKQKV